MDEPGPPQTPRMKRTEYSPARFGTAAQVEVLDSLAPAVVREMEAHEARRKLWFPNDLVAADAEASEAREEEVRQMRMAARDLPDMVRVALALNLLTEEGLPHFHRLIAVYFGPDSPWSDWNHLWTAEEDRHGCAIRDYVRDARLFNMLPLEKAQFAYVRAGFEPNWDQDPYRLLAYTSLQEKATQISHANTARMGSGREPVLQRMLAHVAGDESRHYQFYRAVFGEILRADPEEALHSLLKVTLGFAMPGHNISGFADMSEVVSRCGIFTTRLYKGIVEELLAYWDIGNLVGLSPHAQHNQERLMKVPERLERMAAYAETKVQPREFRFEFIYNRAIKI